jgi:hypothetical protein
MKILNLYMVTAVSFNFPLTLHVTCKLWTFEVLQETLNFNNVFIIRKSQSTIPDLKDLNLKNSLQTAQACLIYLLNG